MFYESFEDPNKRGMFNSVSKSREREVLRTQAFYIANQFIDLLNEAQDTLAKEVLQYEGVEHLTYHIDNALKKVEFKLSNPFDPFRDGHYSEYENDHLNGLIVRMGEALREITILIEQIKPKLAEQASF